MPGGQSVHALRLQLLKSPKVWWPLHLGNQARRCIRLLVFGTRLLFHDLPRTSWVWRVVQQTHSVLVMTQKVDTHSESDGSDAMRQALYWMMLRLELENGTVSNTVAARFGVRSTVMKAITLRACRRCTG